MRPHFSIGKDRTVLLICMGISLMFWIFVKLSKTYEISEAIPLQYRLPPGRQFVDPPPASLRVNLSGTGWKLLYHYLLQKKPTVAFDLSLSLVQEIPRDELISRIEQATDLSITNMSTNYLRISLDAKASRRVPLVLDADIEYRNDYYLRDSIILMPDSVTIYGSMQLLDDISFLKTEKLTLNGPQSDERLVLKILKPENGPFELSTNETEVFIPVEQFTEKSFTLPIHIANARDSVRILPATATVTCLVGLSRYEELNETNFVIQADFGELEDLSQQNYVPLVLAVKPEWVRSVDLSPKSVEFFIVE